MRSDVRAARPDVVRRWLLAGSLVVGAVVVALLGWGVLPGDRGGVGGSAAATTTDQESPAPVTATVTPPPISPSPSGPTAVATELPPEQEAVPLDVATEVGDVRVSLVDLEAIQGEATGPGDVAGPALRVTVRMENGTAEPLDLLATSVRLIYGSDQAPASPLGDPSAAAFSGVLEPGDSAEGAYVFRVPVDARDRVTVSVGYQPGAPFAVFTGDV